MPNCKYCEKEFSVCESKATKTGRVSRRKICGSCAVSKRRWKTKIELVEKLGSKCVECGFMGHPSSFHFHHTDPTSKNFSINGNKLLVSERYEELKKCELVCVNCHSVKHTNNDLLKKFGFWKKEWNK
jgi:hypothetical protein